MAAAGRALQAQDAMELAAKRAGLNDFGAPGFEEGLERTLDAFARLPLTAKAREEAFGKVVYDLSNRLRVEQWYKDHPEVEGEEIEGPLLVCGLPRTGTTATVGMLATDPRFRFLRAWEALSPVPPPVAGKEQDDPRAVAARERARAMDQTQHIVDADGPEEDLVMLAPLDMHAYHGAYPMPDDYLDWWKQADFSSTFAYHRRVLKLLQSRRGPRLWLLKAPVHLFKFDAFAAEYPDAKYIWTHRDPAKVIPSVSSLQYRLNAERCEDGKLEKRAYGPNFLTFWAEGIERGLASRARIGEGRFVDVWNDDVVARPIETFAGLYGELGFDFTRNVRDALEGYRTRNAKGVHGAHRYTAEEYGTSRDAIREAFAGYIERFRL